MAPRSRPGSRFLLALRVFCTVACTLAQLTTVQSNDTRLKYSGHWSPYSADSELFDFLFMSTPRRGSKVTLEFEGYLIEYWSVRGATNGGLCRIDIDGQYIDTVSSTKKYGYTSPSILFQKQDLDPSKRHTITVTAVDVNPWASCQVESFVYAAASPVRPLLAAVSPTSIPKDPSWGDKPSSSAPTAAIVGGVLGGVIFLALVAATLWHARRRRASKRLDDIYFPDLLGDAVPLETPGGSQVSLQQIQSLQNRGDAQLLHRQPSLGYGATASTQPHRPDPFSGNSREAPTLQPLDTAGAGGSPIQLHSAVSEAQSPEAGSSSQEPRLPSNTTPSTNWPTDAKVSAGEAQPRPSWDAPPQYDG
ncbi:hypothetical protein BOTBODRAFT_41242 [Botryobasidium botryosum FD-172 SS1]|uniref:Uncharacterized protein n=1 Tax=Botryobasidium botryosum (strain FD-172 SS1) TaxID=930990 RepID=A0A067N873_BOTB1|nr:hypothetical protein BOTBODRAFT_41242 [Botryobasidium botryosum FD-172 SS1]